jgi:hypothetical protein
MLDSTGSNPVPGTKGESMYPIATAIELTGPVPLTEREIDDQIAASVKSRLRKVTFNKDNFSFPDQLVTAYQTEGYAVFVSANYWVVSW